MKKHLYVGCCYYYLFFSFDKKFQVKHIYFDFFFYEPTEMGCRLSKLIQPVNAYKSRNQNLTASFAPPSSVDFVPIIGQDFETENLEAVTLIWLDESIDETKEDCKRTLFLLRKVNNFTRTYTDCISCMKYIKSIN